MSKIKCQGFTDFIERNLGQMTCTHDTFYVLIYTFWVWFANWRNSWNWKNDINNYKIYILCFKFQWVTLSNLGSPIISRGMLYQKEVVLSSIQSSLHEWNKRSEWSNLRPYAYISVILNRKFSPVSNITTTVLCSIRNIRLLSMKGVYLHVWIRRCESK